MPKMTDFGLKLTQRYTKVFFVCLFVCFSMIVYCDRYLVQQVLRNVFFGCCCCCTHAVREAVLGARRVRKTAKDP